MEPINPSQLMRKYDSLNLLPEDFQDPRDCEPMVNPFIHIACGKSAEEASIRECLEFNGRCVSCNEEATIEQFVVNRNLRSVLEEFPMKVLSVIDQQEWEVNELRVDNRSKDQRIGLLEGENEHLTQENREKDGTIFVLEEENTGLKGRVTDLTGERDLEREEKLEAIANQELLARENRVLNQEMERLNIHQEPSIQEFITEHVLSDRYSPEEWVRKLSSQKKHSEGMLENLLKGFGYNPINYVLSGCTLGRTNAFVSRAVGDQDEKHQRIVKRFLEERKQEISQLVKSMMVKHSQGIVDVVLLGTGNTLVFSDREFDGFIGPLIDRLINEGLISDRANALMRQHEVSLQELPTEEWQRQEVGRKFPKTYEDSIKEILSHVFRIELCDQLTTAFYVPPVVVERIRPPRRQQEEDYAFVPLAGIHYNYV